MKAILIAAIVLFIAHSLYTFGRDAAQRVKPSECMREVPTSHTIQTELV